MENGNLNISPRLCFVMAASPTDGFLSQVGMFRLSLNSLGGIYENADLVLFLGHETLTEIPARWTKHLDKGVLINWADPLEFQRIGIRAQGDKKWTYDYSAYDLIIFCDADTILIRPLDELLLLVQKRNAIAGVIAHYPFPHNEDEKPDELWQSFSRRYTGKDIQLDHTYTLLINSEQNKNKACPFYINFGFVVMTPQVFAGIRESYLDIRSKIAPLLMAPIFSGQIALTLAIHRHDVPAHSIEMKYNFPNDPIAERLYPDQMKDISVIHYLRTQKFDRQTIFATQESFNEFLLLDLEGSNKVFQDHIRAITHGSYPFRDPNQGPSKARRIIPNRKSNSWSDRLPVNSTGSDDLPERSAKMLRKIVNLIVQLKNLAFLSRNAGLIKSSGLFDETWYLTRNPDVAKTRVDPAVHYLKFGGFEGRDPCPAFSSQFYLDSNPDVREARFNPLLHYLKYGKKEGRPAQPAKTNR